MAAKARTFLMFEGKAEEALSFYTSTIPESHIVDIVRYGAEQSGKAGTVLVARAVIAGQEILVTDSPVHHDFTFTPAISFFVDCSSAGEVDRLATALAEGGQFLMPLDNYAFSKRFAWVNDRFGVSWQINLP